MEPEQTLIQAINRRLNTGEISEATLQTDDRVLARITDGIYRQPASALRELIANAYDADATEVYIQMDAPRFSKILIRDNGSGFSIESLARLIYHIGGSPKRIQEGVRLGVTSPIDPTLSPKGRRLIGKIGIGLFSVAQLTRHFQLITKTKGSTHRLVADVILKTYTEDNLQKEPEPGAEPGKKIVKTGNVRIKAVPANDVDWHGTEIILMDLRPQTKELLQSQNLWQQVESNGDEVDPENLLERRSKPKYHIGRIETGSANDDVLREKANLPWTQDDPPNERFKKLYQAIIDAVKDVESNPRLEMVLDNYLRTMWNLSLAGPLDYIERHPFDLTGSDEPEIFELANAARGQATRLDLKPQESVRERLRLLAPERGAEEPFNVFIDEVQLFRPLRFNDLPKTKHALKKPLLFVGKFEPDLSPIPIDERGGDFAFEAYFLWTHKVVPKEHNGILVRVGDASGTGFDETFMKYQVSEQTRLRQITAEVFVRKGLDAALNIDRESFNYAHPHYQILVRWVHRALRQLTNMHKQLAKDIRQGQHKKKQRSVSENLNRIIDSEINRPGKGLELESTEVLLVDTGKQEDLFAGRKEGSLVFNRDEILAGIPEHKLLEFRKKNELSLLEERIKGVALLLEAYGVFENMHYKKQSQLLAGIISIMLGGEAAEDAGE